MKGALFGRILIVYISTSLFFIPVATLSAEVDFQVLVTTSDGKKIGVSDVSQISGDKFYRASWNSSKVKINFNDILSIKFKKREPGDKKWQYRAQIEFKDGKSDTFLLGPLSDLKGSSKYGISEIHHRNIASIQFGVVGSKQPESKQKEGEITADVDTILLKNGDIVSGNIHNPTLRLRTSYGDMSFEKNKVGNIDFEGGGQNIDVVILKIGDKLSGVIEDEVVKISLRSGNEIEINTEKIKSIIMKK